MGPVGTRISAMAAGNATSLLVKLRTDGAGQAETTERLAELLYPELHALAAGLMRRERPGHTLQPTAVVHEAFLRLIDQNTIEWQDRAHFLGIAARVMRRILVDHARRRDASKRGGDSDRVTFDENLFPRQDASYDLLVLDEALLRLTALDARSAQVAELRIFGGLTVREAAEALGVSARTIDHDWAMARLWLTRELSPP